DLRGLGGEAVELLDQGRRHPDAARGLREVGAGVVVGVDRLAGALADRDLMKTDDAVVEPDEPVDAQCPAAVAAVPRAGRLPALRAGPVRALWQPVVVDDAALREHGAVGLD